MDRFIKFSYFIFTIENIDIKQLAYIILRTIVYVYKLLMEVISDKGIIFVSKFWQSFMVRLGLNLKLTIIFRP